MKVIKCTNFKTGEFYFAAVEDSDYRTDPSELFSDTYLSKSHNHITMNVNVEILRSGVPDITAKTEVAILQKRFPTFKRLPEIAKTKTAKSIPVIEPVKEETQIDVEITPSQPTTNINKTTKK